MASSAAIFLLLVASSCCCEFDHQNQETKCDKLEFSRDKPIQLKQYGNKLDLAQIRGALISGAFPLLPGMKDLTIRSSNISSIDRNFLDSFPNLEVITIKINHGFPEMTAAIFGPSCCNKLRILKLYDNNFKTFDNKLFKKIPNLENLWIEKQNLGQLSRNYFAGLPKLRKLHLQHCQISRIEVGAFDDVTQLQKVEISLNNKLEKIQSGTFRPLTKLEELQLNGDNIKNITGEEFEGLESVKKLELLNNKILHIDIDKMLENLPKLERIYLKLHAMECQRAKLIMERLLKRKVDIKNSSDFLSYDCKQTKLNVKENV